MQLGGYEVTGEIGRGGMGIVLRARARDGRDVAIKLLQRADAKNALARFDRERRLIAALDEPAGFVPLLDAGESERGPFIVMPFVAGGTLRDRIRSGNLTTEQSVAIVRDVAAAVGRAHERGIVHRDLKPENILFTAEGRPLVTDLGLAKHFRHDSPGASRSEALSVSGEMKGTIGYMAPEQTAEAKSVGPPADVFSLGAIFYETLTGKGAFDGDSVHSVIVKVIEGKYEPLRALRPDLPRWLETVLARALAKDPAARWQNGAELARAIDDGPKLEAARAAKRVVAVGIAAALVLGAMLLTMQILRAHPRSSAPTPSAISPTPSASPSPKLAKPDGPPPWFDKLAPADRPPLPLPKGVVFGRASGEYANEKDGSVLVFVPGGAFTMGANADCEVYEKPAHTVRLSPYFIGKLTVTNEQFAAFVKATSHRTKAEIDGGVLGFHYDAERNPDVAGISWRFPLAPDKPCEPRCPVVQVAFEDAQAYCAWAELRLPTEAEWERAAGWDKKTGKRRKFPWGDTEVAVIVTQGKKVANLRDRAFGRAHPDEVAREAIWQMDDGFAELAPVGSFPEGASAVGALDMAGNVSQWVQDGFSPDFYSRSPELDPVAPDDLQYRTRRGSTFCIGASHVWTRVITARPFRGVDIGFRVARSLGR